MKLDDLLDRLVELDGTDLYVTVGAPPRASVSGRMVDVAPEPVTAEILVDLVRPLIGDPATFERKPDLDLAWHRGGDRFRLNVYRQRGQPALVARRIRGSILTFEQLNLPEVLSELTLARKGLVLVTGSTGSGKSTTLAAMIDHRNRSRAGHIVTLEDPIEFVHEHRMSLVSQREIGIDTASFADALRSALRQAPDVLLVGEIRDRETAEAALQFAETGHLVLATLHSTNAPQTLERILGLFPADRHLQIQMLLSLNLSGIVSQRLVPTVDGGRVAALEILLPTGRIRDLLKQGEIARIRTAIAEGGRSGMRTFDQHLLQLVEEGKIRVEDALAFADSPNDLRISIQLASGEAEVESGIRFA